MDRCRHTCCAQWDIEIDEQSFELYKNLPGRDGDSIRNTVDSSGDVPRFKTDSSGRCLNLCSNGLCRIIKTFGEDALCDVCYDHPRFRNCFSGRIETGLGLCCEAAACLILGCSEPFSLVQCGEDSFSDSLPGYDEIRLLNERDTLFKIISDRKLPLTERIDKISAFYNIETDITVTAAALNQEEFMDESSRRLFTDAAARGKFIITPDLETAGEQLLSYLFFRHFNTNAMGREKAVTGFILSQFDLIFRTLNITGMTKENLYETARIWSGETEYSDINPGLITDLILTGRQ